MRKTIFILLVLYLTSPLFSQQAPPQKDIDSAIEKGAAFLTGKFSKGIPTKELEFELVVYTLIHAEVNPREVQVFKRAIDDLMSYSGYSWYDAKKGVTEKTTYRLAVRALALHSLLVKIKRSNYFKSLYENQTKTIQKKIAESAQYLVDTQLDNGQWTYGGVKKNEPALTTLATGAPPPDSEFNKTASKEAWENAAGLTGNLYKLKPKYGSDARGTDLGKPVELGKQRGDNSNSQYAVLGLIAAEMSGIEVPRTTWELAVNWFEKDQNTDGGFEYGDEGGEEKQEGTGPEKKKDDKKPAAAKGRTGSFGSMTTAGAVALAAAYKYMGRDYKNEKRFQNAVQWLASNFSVNGNPKAKGNPRIPQTAEAYFLYGLERVGAFSGLQKFGGHDWYAAGATQLLKEQKADGSWMIEPKANSRGMDFTIVYDTCFAILFLKRATNDMIESGAAGGKPNDK